MFVETRIRELTPEQRVRMREVRGGASHCQDSRCRNPATHAVWRVAFINREGDQRLFLCTLHAEAAKVLQEMTDSGGYQRWRQAAT
jgi:hypothetical protein